MSWLKMRPYEGRMVQVMKPGVYQTPYLIIVLYSLKKRRSGKEKVFIYVPVGLRAVERDEWRSGQ